VATARIRAGGNISSSFNPQWAGAIPGFAGLVNGVDDGTLKFHILQKLNAIFETVVKKPLFLGGQAALFAFPFPLPFPKSSL
jgi:hypothetical protein